MYLQNYGLQKTWLDKCIKGPVLEDPSTSNFVNGPKQSYCSNFIIFIDPFEEN